MKPRREVFSWCLFDFANSSFTTVIITAGFNLYFTSEIAEDNGSSLWNLAIFLSNVVIILTAPVIGAIADSSRNKKRFLFASYVVCIAATAGLYFATGGMIAYAMLLLIVANVAFASGENLVAGFLPELAEPSELGKVSAWGWGIGYVGGLLALAACHPLLKEDNPDAVRRGITLVVAGFFLVGGIPTFLFVRERGQGRIEGSLRTAARDGFRRIGRTWRERHELRELFRFLLAFLCFGIGLVGVITNAGLYGHHLCDLKHQDVIKVMAFAQIFAVLGALWSGRATRRFGYKKTVAITLRLWILAAVLFLVAASEAGFWTVALLAGFAMGASLASARAMVGLLSPSQRSGEMFGFWGLTMRLSAVLATFGNFILLRMTNEGLRSGIVFFTLSFVLGLILLGRVDERAGASAARAAESNEGRPERKGEMP